MALTAPELETLGRELARRIFPHGTTAHSNLSDLKDAIDAIDTAMAATTNQAATAKSGMTIKAALLEFIQDDVPALSAQEAGVALALWALHEAGIA